MALGVRSTLRCFVVVATLAITAPAFAIELLSANPISIGGQAGWQHDQGDASGFFNTFDALALPGAYTRAHKVHVFLPRRYNQTSERNQRYPVVYMNDGSNVFFTDNDQGCWHLQDRLTELYQTGRLQPIIVVGIVSSDRNQEYTHAPVPTTNSCCMVSEYADYIAHQLKPFIDANYRTDSQRTKTAVIGSSHGGLAAFVTAGRSPEAFGMLAAMSPSFWVNLQPFGPELSLADSSLMSLVDSGFKGASKPRVYVDWGMGRAGGIENSLIESNATRRGREMANLLSSEYRYGPENLRTFEDPAGTHSETSWGSRISDVLVWMFGTDSGN